MNFEIEVNGQPRTVRVERTGTLFRIESEGRVDVVDVARVDRTTISMILDGDRRASHEAALLDRREPGDVEVYLRAGVVQTRVARAPGRKRWSTNGAAPGAADGPQRLTAPMPGKIVKVLVKPGDAVVAGQGLVVIEAMKMENELRASRKGQVKDVHVADGDLVETGRLLAVIA